MWSWRFRILVAVCFMLASCQPSPARPPDTARPPRGLDARASGGQDAPSGAPSTSDSDAGPSSADAITPDDPVAADARDSVDLAPASDRSPVGPDAGGGAFWGTAVAGLPSSTGPVAPATVAIMRGTKTGRVGPGFLGLSFEKSHLTDGFFSTGNATLVALFKLLGSAVLRIGANDADRTTWLPATTPLAPGTFGKTVGTKAVDDLAAFARATGWRVIYALNFKTGTPDNAAAEAKYVTGQLGASLYGFEIGNEINLAGLPYAEVKTRWESFASAIAAAAPGAPLVGPATNPSGLKTYFVPFAHDEGAKVVLLTHHYYRGSGALATSTMDKLLSPDPQLLSVLQTLSAAATGNQIRDGVRLGETASFSSHGAPGVSDAFGSALWALDFFFDNAEHGSAGINFHGGAVGQDGKRPFTYSPIGEDAGAITGARPIFYGMLLMALAGPGDVLATRGPTDPATLGAHALAEADGALDLFLVNKDAARAVKVSVDAGAPIRAAAVVYLEAPALGARDGVKVAGASISAKGNWSPPPPFALAPAGAGVDVLVPAASAALVHLN